MTLDMPARAQMPGGFGIYTARKFVQYMQTRSRDVRQKLPSPTLRKIKEVEKENASL
jgi:hypothetical protein